MIYHNFSIKHCIILLLAATFFMSSGHINGQEKTDYIVADSVLYKGDTAQIELNDSVRGTIQWQRSHETDSWEDIEGENETELLQQITDTVFFRAKITEDDCEPIYSEAVRIDIGIPTAAFTSDTANIAEGDTINFEDQSDGNPDTWNWDFGDGNASNEQNPSHIYSTEGTYTVELTVSYDNRKDTATKTDYITVGSAPTSAFSSDTTNISEGETINFEDQSSGDIDTWSWEFGDGDTSSYQNPSHTYSSAGTYMVELTVSNEYGEDTETKTDYIIVTSNGQTACDWNNSKTFTDSRDGQTYLQTQIGDQCWMAENLNYDQNSYGNDWCYGNNSSNCDTYGRLYDWAAVMQGESSNNSNSSGVQGVCPDGWYVPSDEEWKELEMQLGMSQSEADNTSYRGTNEGSKLAGNASFWRDGNLTDNSAFGSSGFTALPGGFRKNNGSFDKLGFWGFWWSSTDDLSPDAWSRYLHNYRSKVYRYDRSKESGFSVRCYTTEPPTAAFSANKTTINTDGFVQFTDESTDAPKSWSWDFGDGSTSSEQNPSHNYSTEGTYTVELTVSNVAGADTITKTDYITVESPLTACDWNNDTTFTDSRNGQEYKQTKIGDQCWMAENLNYDQDAFGNDWCYDNDDSNCDTYGRLYNWDAIMQGTSSSNSNPSDVQGVCPDGWHVPSDEEWKELEMELGMSQSEVDNIGYRGTNEGSKLAGNASLWNDGNLTDNSAFGSSGFKALPGGTRSDGGNFNRVGIYGVWWSSTLQSYNYAFMRLMVYDHSNVPRGGTNRGYGLSVRCVYGYTTESPTAAFSADQTTIVNGDTIQFIDESTNYPTSWSWDFGDGNTSSEQNPSHTYSSAGTYTVELTVSNEYGEDTETKTEYITVEECPNTLTDSRDGQTYTTVQIGEQCWMAENLNYDQNSYGSDWCYDNNSSNCDTYGRLYDWAAVMQGESSSDEIPSGVQGVCPEGWHVPSDEEWKELEMELGMSQSEVDNTGFRGTNEGSKLAGNASLWGDGNLTDNSAFGSSGFKALPGGYRGDAGSFSSIGSYGSWWSSTANLSTSAWYRGLFFSGSDVYRGDDDKDYGFSVRCLRD